MDIKKLTDKDKEIFVMRLAQACPLTKSHVWKCVAKMEDILWQMLRASGSFQIYGMAADKVETQAPHSFSAFMQMKIKNLIG